MEVPVERACCDFVIAAACSDLDMAMILPGLKFCNSFADVYFPEKGCLVGMPRTPDGLWVEKKLTLALTLSRSGVSCQSFDWARMEKLFSKR